MPEESQQPRRTRIRVIRISLLMASIFVFFQLLPDLAPERPSNLLRELTGDGQQELCDTGNLGFQQVNALRSPVSMRAQARGTVSAGEEVPMVVAFSTPGGRPLGEDELEITHTEKVHLLVIDESLDDYYHVHPEPGNVRGEYRFRFRPRKGGEYKVFADLMPKVTGRPIQAVSSVTVAGEGSAPEPVGSEEAMVEGYQFSLDTPPERLRANRPAVVTLRARSTSAGAPVTLEPVMDAYAHLVVFDMERSGFAHLHPVEDGLDVDLDERAPELRFVFHVAEPGFYRIWAQMRIDGEQVFVPFGVEVAG